jgi:hypothetical protein
MSPKRRRRLLVLISLAGLAATLWSLRSRLLARNQADFEHRYGNGVSGG